MATESKKLHIAMFPWLAFGHMIPYLELAKLIAQKGHKISFISTPRNIDRFPKLPPNLARFINFVKLPLPPTRSLPENAEATIDVPYDKVKYLKIAYDGLGDSLTDFLKFSCPDWILHDFASYWLPPIAAELKVCTAFFSIVIAAFLGVVGPTDGSDDRATPEDFTVPPKWAPFQTTVRFKMFEILRVFGHSIAEDDEEVAVTDMFRIKATIRDCDTVVVRSSYEVEPEWLKLLEAIHRKPIIPVGQLPTTAYDDGKSDDEWDEIRKWLDQQDKRSVVYVAFGSEAKPSQIELNEIALGLELSGMPFFWVLRKQRGTADTELVELPDGFEDRVKGRGIICTSWAPQLKILSHDSVGGFLTHSGWSSVVEAIQCEKSLILLTFLSDQGINARILEEKRIGYSIPRDELDGSFTRNSVADSVKMVMVEQEGKIFREKVKEVKGIFADRDLQFSYVDNLLSFLANNKNKNI